MRKVAPGTSVPSGVRTTPVRRNSAGAVVSGVCCAASEIPQTAINQSSTASLLPSTSHAHSSPEHIPFSRSRSSIIFGEIMRQFSSLSAACRLRRHCLRKGYPRRADQCLMRWPARATRRVYMGLRANIYDLVQMPALTDDLL